jgi:hypothetical protein
MGRRAKNLLISEPVLLRTEEYCRQHGIALSRLVEDFLANLPERTWSREEPEAGTGSPIVARLRSAAHRFDMEDEEYGVFLQRRWGGDRREYW